MSLWVFVDITIASYILLIKQIIQKEQACWNVTHIYQNLLNSEEDHPLGGCCSNDKLLPP